MAFAGESTLHDRMLLAARDVAAGDESVETVEALAGTLTAALDGMRQLPRVADAPAVGAAVDAYRSAVRGVAAAARLQDATRLEAAIAAADVAAHAVRQAESEFATALLHTGPTPIPLVNLALRTVDRLRDGLLAGDHFQEALAKCREALGHLLPPYSAPEAATALEQAQAILLRLEDAVRRGDAAAVGDERSRLADAGHNLALYLRITASDAWDEEENLLDFVEGGAGLIPGAGLPRLLGSMLDLGAAYAAGAADAAAIERAAGQLDRIVARFHANAAEVREGRELLPAMEAAVSLLAQAAESFHALAAGGDGRALEAAQALLEQASDGLLEMRDGVG